MQQGVRWDSWILCVAIVALYFNSNCKTANALSSEDAKSPDEDQKTFAKKGAPSGLWFGPRLGKRSQDMPLNEQNLRRLLMEAAVAYSGDLGASDMDSLRNTFYTITDGKPVDGTAGSKRRFTPRLGRESGEQEIVGNPRTVDFIPRLGRELTSPWMYQDGDYLLYGRSADDAKPVINMNRTPLFAPRLGRALALLLQAEKPESKDGVLRIARSAKADNDKNKKLSSFLLANGAI